MAARNSDQNCARLHKGQEPASLANDDLVTAYIATLATKAPGTVDVYHRTLRQLASWLAERPGSTSSFQPAQLTVTALDTYLADLAHRRISISHRARVKTVVNGFARWLIEERGLLRRNPARQVSVPALPG